jgi:AraC-like DNA-binding protein
MADRIKVPAAFWRILEARGIPASALFRQARLPAIAQMPGHMLTTDQYFALLRALETLDPEPGLGITLIRDADTSIHPPPSLCAFYARDLRDGIERLVRYKRLCTPAVWTMSEGGRQCVIELNWVHATGPEPAISVDVAFATIVELARRATGHAVNPLRVEYRRSGPHDERYRAYFQAHVIFGADADRLILDALDLDQPFPGHNPELIAMMTPVLGAALQELDQQADIACLVVSSLKRSLPSGRPELKHVARDLGMSDRTLQRRITEAGTSFRDLLAEARRDLSQTLLANDAVQIDEIAFLLGYHDSSSFHRAFRDWEGVSPRRWRECNARREAALG